jgi:hypothetical protein
VGICEAYTFSNKSQQACASVALVSKALAEVRGGSGVGPGVGPGLGPGVRAPKGLHIIGGSQANLIIGKANLVLLAFD